MTLLAVLLSLCRPRLVQFTRDHEMRVFWRGVSDAVFLLVGEGDEAIDLIDRMEKEKISLDFVLVEPAIGEQYEKVVRETFGMEPSSLPAAFYVQGSTKYKYRVEGEINKDNIEATIREARNGLRHIWLKTEIAPPLAEQSGPVYVATTLTLKELVQEGEDEVLLDIYSPWCGACKELEPHFLEAARELKGQGKKIKLAKIDITKNDVPLVDITGFPMLVFYGKDKSKPPSSPKIQIFGKNDVLSFLRSVSAELKA